MVAFTIIQAAGAVASITGRSTATLVQSFNKKMEYLTQKWQEEEKARYFEQVPKIISKGLHTKVLEEIYPPQDLQENELVRVSVFVDGERCPTALAAKPEFVCTQVNLEDENKYALDKPENSLPNLDIDIVAQSLAEIQLFNLNIWNQSIYRLLDIKMDESHLVTTFSNEHKEDFLRYRCGLGSLWHELLQGLLDVDVDTLIQEWRQHLKRRAQLLGSVEAIADYKKRLCVGGIHATVAILREDKDDYIIPVQRRSMKVGGGQGMISLLPEAYHQPMVSPQNELDFRLTFYRELYEELLGGKELEKKSKHLCHDWYMDDLEDLGLLASTNPKCTLEITGIAFNLISGNYEVSVLFVIRDKRFWNKNRKRLVTNWETSEVELPFFSTKYDLPSVKKALLKHDWIGSGLYSIARGLERLGEIDKARVDISGVKVNKF